MISSNQKDKTLLMDQISGTFNDLRKSNVSSFNEFIDNPDSDRKMNNNVQFPLNVKSINNRSNSNDHSKAIVKEFNSFTKLKRALT